MTVIEEVPDEGLDLNLVQVRKQRLDAINQERYDKVLVRTELVWLSIILIDSLHDNGAVLYCADQLLEDEPLELEATDMTVICHDCEDVSHY